MSTRCQIGFYNDDKAPLDRFDAIIYRHHDGYPESEEGVMAALERFKVENKRGHDAEYNAAWLLNQMITRYLAHEHDPYLGFGVCKDFHGDINYYYALYPDRTEVYQVGRDYQLSDGLERGDIGFTRTLGGITFKLIERTK